MSKGLMRIGDSERIEGVRQMRMERSRMGRLLRNSDEMFEVMILNS